MDHIQYMRQALELAEKGCGYVNPNPMVGAVIVKNGKVIGSGFHKKAGEPHAERIALAACEESPEGATLYVTLEPCCHYGRTPPCTEEIIKQKIGTVVVGAEDPNPEVAGKGIETLRKSGIQVITGILEAECGALNASFFHHIRTQTPYVAMKYAMTLDGKIASVTGESKWITGETARKHVHQLRHQYTGIMVGIGTVIADDPMLNCRLAGTLHPTRIVCDTNLRISEDAAIVRTACEIPTYIAYCGGDLKKQSLLEKRGCRMLKVRRNNGKLDLNRLMELLYEQGIDSILLEGGATLNEQALRCGVVQKIYGYIAPKLLGGEAAKGPVGGEGIPHPDNAVRVRLQAIRQLDEDVLMEYNVEG